MRRTDFYSRLKKRTSEYKSVQSTSYALSLSSLYFTRWNIKNIEFYLEGLLHEIGLICIIKGHSFPCHWITKAAVDICIIQKKILTNLHVLALYGPEFYLTPVGWSGTFLLPCGPSALEWSDKAFEQASVGVEVILLFIAVNSLRPSPKAWILSAFSLLPSSSTLSLRLSKLGRWIRRENRHAHICEQPCCLNLYLARVYG